jgi:protease I
MGDELHGRRIAFMTANEGAEEVELTEPWQAGRDAGGIPELLAPEAGQAQAFNHLDKAGTFPVDRAISDADPAGYDALVLPGGVANPDQLRTIPAAVEFTRAVFQAGKPAAVICHGPWTLVEAGGTWVDSEVQVCTAGANVLVTSRKPDDLPAFCKDLVEKFQQAG